MIDDGFGWARDFWAAYIRDNTIGTKIITASHYPNEGLAWYVFILCAIVGFEIFKRMAFIFRGLAADFFRYSDGFFLFL